MAASAGGGRWFNAGVVWRNATNGSEAKWKVGDGGLHWNGFGNGIGRGGRQRDNGRYMGDAFQWIGGVEDGRVIGGRPSSAIRCVKLKGKGKMLRDERVVETASKAVDISHHARWTMKHLEEVAEEFLSPTSDLVDGPVVFEDSFDSGAITKPKEFGTPKKFPVLADAPATAAGFTNKGVKTSFALGTFTRTKTDRAEASAAHGNIEMANASCTKSVESSEGSRGVVRLH